MSVLVWPSELPGPIHGSYRVKPQDTVLRTQMDAGPARRRVLFTAGSKYVEFELALNQVELEILLNFYYSTTQRVLPFDWIDPHTQGPAQYCFSLPPEDTQVDDGEYEVQVRLERLP